MDIDKVINGYMRLWCKIYGIPEDADMSQSPKRCRVCGGELDVKYIKRGRGYLCRECLNTKRRERTKHKT